MEKTINIAYSCNEAYIQQTGISIISLLEHNKDIEHLRIFFIAKDVGPDSIKMLEEICARYYRQLVVIPFESICARLNISNVGRHIATVYAKLFFGNIPEVEKVLYLDSDIIVNGSLQPLADMDMGENVFACVKTVTKDYCRALGLAETDDFFNDGMALVNASALRKENLEDQFIKFIERYKGNPPVLSEGVINVVCKNRIAVLHPRYNLSTGFLMLSNKKLRAIAHQPHTFYSDETLNDAKRSPVLIHFLSGWFKRPWEKGCTHPMKEFYNKYKRISPWKDAPLEEKKIPLKLQLLRVIYNIMPVKLISVIRKKQGDPLV